MPDGYGVVNPPSGAGLFNGTYVPLSEVGAANGVAPLDSNELVPVVNLPLSTTTIVLMGIGTPADTLGLNNDYYLDVSSGNAWGPKSAGTWVGTKVAQFIEYALAALISAERPGTPKSGEYLVTANGGSTSTLTLTSTQKGEVYYVPIDVANPAGQTFTGLSTSLTGGSTGGTSPTILMSLYPDDGTGTRPSSTVAHNTAYDCSFTPTGTGTIDVAFGSAQTLAPGRYWAALLYTDSGAPSPYPILVTLSPLSNSVLPSLANSSLKGWYQGGASSLPGTAAPSKGFGAYPIIGLKAQ